MGWSWPIRRMALGRVLLFWRRWPMAFRAACCLLAVPLLLADWIPLPSDELAHVTPALILPHVGHSFFFDLKQLGIEGPSDREGTSALVLREDGRELLPGQTHAAIATQSGGRCSHWGHHLFFSSSDQSDPRANGKVYSLTLPHRLGERLDGLLAWLPPALAKPAFWGLLVLLLGLSPAVTAGLDYWRYRSVPWLLVLAGATGAWWLLAVNRINVATLGGKLSYLGALLGLVFLLLLQLFGQFRASRVASLQRLSAAARVYGWALHTGLMVALLFLLFEAGARLVPVFDAYAVNPGSRYFWPEWYQPRNSLGYHDREPSAKRGPRVLLLGDSFTEGAGVRSHERFSARLEQIWREKQPGLEVFAGACCGFDTLDEAELLEKTGDRLGPDLVVVCYVLNDAERDSPQYTPSPAARWLNQALLQKFPSYLFYRMRAVRQTTNWAEIEANVRRQHQPESPGWKYVQDGLDRIARWCDERNVARAFVALPLFVTEAQNYRVQMEQAVIAARQRGFEAFSLLDAFDGRWGDFALSRYELHPSAEAHSRIARFIADRVRVPEMRFRLPQSNGVD